MSQQSYMAVVQTRHLLRNEEHKNAPTTSFLIWIMPCSQVRVRQRTLTSTLQIATQPVICYRLCALFPFSLMVGKKIVHKRATTWKKRFQHTYSYIAKGKHWSLKLGERYFLFSIPKKRGKSAAPATVRCRVRLEQKRQPLLKQSRSEFCIKAQEHLLKYATVWISSRNGKFSANPPFTLRLGCQPVHREHALKALSRQQPADCPLLLLAGGALRRQHWIRGWKVHF